MVEMDVCAPCASDYELSREERIRENRERMRKLGIFNLSDKVKSLKPAMNGASRRRVSKRGDRSPLPQPGSVRRSSRLQNSTPVSYCENVANKEISINDHLLRENGSKPEVYTEEHEKLLGSTERIWTFFVDGYGKDGKRIYDPVKGKTCHQCRQKTLGHRTTCSQCNMVQGQFCGDCLYMRYGENVLEANENPNWICPVCRGICNCSLCRQAKGWAPTGTLYRKISSLGYKSVAHYLIQTRRASADSGGTKLPIHSRRSLPFSDMESTMDEDDLFKASDNLSANNNEGNDNTTPEMDQVEHPVNPKPEQREPEHELEKEASNASSEPLNNQIHPVSNNVIVAETSPKSNKKRVHSQPSLDSIAGRLRQRRSNLKVVEELKLGNSKKCPRKVKGESDMAADANSIASRLKRRREGS
ncbi:uncharacterized protein LOC127258287 [Andrographis paniculata]|uniref:uncharacterized protein LOC127258287 n=1 Tax=Andrographis paniculata TaxID=175694 RepID=UPI0021E77A59|nr:uncharacterized protein LOC127258287 [Andrographis paniculata]